MLRYVFRITAVLILVPTYCTSLASAADSWDRLYEDLINNASELTPIEISWTLTRNPREKIQTVLKRLGKSIQRGDDRVFFAEECGSSAIKDGKVLAHFQFKEAILTPKTDFLDKMTGNDPVFIPDNMIKSNEVIDSEFAISFDGESMYTQKLSANKTTDLLTIRNPSDALRESQSNEITQELAGRRWRYNYWELAGFKVPDSEYEFGDSKITSLLLYYIETNNVPTPEIEEVEWQGGTCVAVRVPMPIGHFIFYLKTSLRNAVWGIERYNDKEELVSVSTASEFKRLEGSSSMWFPHRIDSAFYSPDVRIPPGREVLYVETIKLVSISRAVDESSFVLKALPGSVVADSRIRGALTEKGVKGYVMPADQSILDETIDGEINSPSKWLKSSFLVLNLVLIIGLFAIILIRRLKV